MSVRRSWQELLPGVLTFAAIAAAAIAILVFARVGALHGDTFRLFVAVSDSRGLMKGSEVWLEGQKVGVVHSVAIQPPSVDSTRRVLLSLDLLSSYRPQVRRDSRVQVRAGGSLIGAQVVYLGVGTLRSRAVAEGDTLVGHPQSDLQEMTAEFGLASRELPAIIGNVKLLGRQLQSAEGTLGALGLEPEHGTPVAAARVNAARLGARLSGGQGTLALAMSGRGALMTRASHAMAGVDSIRALLASGSTSLGRFRRDSTLLRDIGTVRDELAAVRALLDSPEGTVGRVRQDRAIQEQLASAQQEMSALFADIKAHPSRYVRF